MPSALGNPVGLEFGSLMKKKSGNNKVSRVWKGANINSSGLDPRPEGKEQISGEDKFEQSLSK